MVNWLNWLAVIFTTMAIFLLSKKNNLFRWGYAIGLIGQVFWIASALILKQLWLLVASVIITYSFACGFIDHFWVERDHKFENIVVHIERLV